MKINIIKGGSLKGMAGSWIFYCWFVICVTLLELSMLTMSCPISFLPLRSPCKYATAAVALVFLGDLVLEPRDILDLGLKRYRAVLNPLQTSQMAVQDLNNLVDLYTPNNK